MPAKTICLRRVRPLLIALTLLVAVGACAQAPPDQVEVGSSVYQDRCATCHGSEQQGTDAGPALIDVTPTGIRRAVIEGVDEDPAYPEMVPLPLTSGQLDAVVAFLTGSGTAD